MAPLSQTYCWLEFIVWASIYQYLILQIISCILLSSLSIYYKNLIYSSVQYINSQLIELQTFSLSTLIITLLFLFHLIYFTTSSTLNEFRFWVVNHFQEHFPHSIRQYFRYNLIHTPNQGYRSILLQTYWVIFFSGVKVTKNVLQSLGMFLKDWKQFTTCMMSCFIDSQFFIDKMKLKLFQSKTFGTYSLSHYLFNFNSPIWLVQIVLSSSVKYYNSISSLILAQVVTLNLF